MKTITTIIFLILFATISAHAQTYSDSLATKCAHGIYFELYGPGLVYSANYDTRFSHRQDGVGGRIGISYLGVDGVSIFTLPMEINYLLGKHGKYFEIGLGATYVKLSEDSEDKNEVLYIDHSGFIGTLNFGYRRQPLDGGFMFRAGVSPIFGEHYAFVPYPYISFGYSF